MRTSTSLSVGSRNVGSIAVDGDLITGSGGPAAPALEIPLELEILSNSPGETVALVALAVTVTCSLSGTRHWARLGTSQLRWPAGDRGGLILSPTSGRPSRHTATAVIDLHEPRIRALDASADAAAGAGITLRIEFSPTFAWVRWVSNQIPVANAIAEREVVEAPHWLGLVSDAHPIWDARSTELTLTVGRERWAETILPGLGLDRVRLVSVTLPKSSAALPDDLVRRFDAARRHFELGEHRAAIQGLRDLRTAIEHAVGATKQRPLATRVAEVRGLELSDPVPRFYGGLRDALAALDNAAHHDFAPHARSDARAALLLTAVLLEAIEDLIRPG